MVETKFRSEYGKVDKLAAQVLEHLGKERAGDGMLALSFALGRLIRPPESADSEIAFAKDLLDWASAYLRPVGGMN